MNAQAEKILEFARGKLVALDPALIVTPPKGLEVGYVPIVTHQARR